MRRIKAAPPKLSTYEVSLRQLKRGVIIIPALTFKGTRQEVNHRGDLTIFSGPKAVACFASGSWLMSQQREERAEETGDERG